MSSTLRASTLAICFALGAGFALAQATVDPSTAQELKKQDPVPPATGRNLPEQAGTQEPSSKVPGTSTDPNAVFVNGVLTVPGAPTDVDTAPAKYSARTNADDQLPIAAYRLRHLGVEQRREIAGLLGTAWRPAAGPTATSGAQAIVGAVLPPTLSYAPEIVQPLPEAVTTKFPELKDAGFTRSADGRLLLVDRDNRLVIAVL
jgi:hypothetical protein